MVLPADVSGLVLAQGHEALEGTAGHVLEVAPGPHTGKVVAHLHTGGGLAVQHVAVLTAHHTGALIAHPGSGQDLQATAVVGALLHGVLAG